MITEIAEILEESKNASIAATNILGNLEIMGLAFDESGDISSEEVAIEIECIIQNSAEESIGVAREVVKMLEEMGFDFKRDEELESYPLWL